MRAKRNGVSIFIYEDDSKSAYGLLRRKIFNKIEKFEDEIFKEKYWKEFCLANASKEL